MKYFNYLLLISIFSFLTCEIYAQLPTSNYFNITKKQMYSNFDEMVALIKEVNPQLGVRFKATGFNQLDSINKFRSRIEEINNYPEYLFLLNHVLALQHDIHARMVRQPLGAKGSEYCDTSIMRTIWAKYQEERNKNLNPYTFFSKYMMNGAVYLSGNYYITGTWHVIDTIKLDTLIISKAKILSYNGQPFQTYINKCIMKDVDMELRWDFDNNQLYSEWVIERDGTIKVENYDGKIIILPLKNYTFTNLRESKVTINKLDSFKKETKRKNYPNTLVEYFDEQRILYIYLYQMQDTEKTLKTKIKEIGKNKVIDKVIVDIRNNRGGNDLTWHNILKSIINDTLIIKGTVALRKSKITKKLFSNELANRLKITEAKIPIIDDNKTYLISDNEITLIPDEDGLKYDGNIYVLQDKYIYSSAQAFTSIANQYEKLITVGERNGLLGGLGTAPWVFQLKYSKFTFLIEPILDISNVIKIEDFYHDRPKVIINPTIDEYFERRDDRVLGVDIRSKEYLLNNDPLFRKILEF